jgi:hypothetical protein
MCSHGRSTAGVAVFIIVEKPATARIVELRLGLVKVGVCVDPMIRASVQSQTEYLHKQIAWNRCFAEIYTQDFTGH